MSRLYLYLASRNKKGIKLITVLKGPSQVTSRLTDVTSLKLPPVWTNQIQKLVSDNKMLYEAWIESAKDFNELRERLKVRGFTETSVSPIPMLSLEGYDKAPKADTSSCEVRSSMIRKKY